MENQFPSSAELVRDPRGACSRTCVKEEGGMHRIRHLFDVPLPDKFILMAREQLRVFLPGAIFTTSRTYPLNSPSFLSLTHNHLAASPKKKKGL